MLKGNKTNQRDEEPDPANMAPEEFSTNEQGNVVPLFAGEAKFALTWVCEPFAVFTKDAPDESAKK